MDAVYVVRAGDRNEELRYSLRALAAHLPHGRVWVAGYNPSWVRGVEYLPLNQRGRSRYENTRLNLLEACRTPEVSDTFVLMHDDLFVLAPVQTVPLYHRGTLERVIGGRPPENVYQRGLIASLALLRSWGHADPLDYELHLPMVIEKARMLETIERTMSAAPVVASALKTIHCNLWDLGGEEIADVKILPARSSLPSGAVFTSTTDSSFKLGRVGEQLRKRFPQASRYEAA